MLPLVSWPLELSVTSQANCNGKVYLLDTELGPTALGRVPLLGPSGNRRRVGRSTRMKRPQNMQVDGRVHYRRLKMAGGETGKGAVSYSHFVAFPYRTPASELFSQRAVHGGDVQEGRVKRSIGAGYVGHSCGVFGYGPMWSAGGLQETLIRRTFAAHSCFLSGCCFRVVAAKSSKHKKVISPSRMATPLHLAACFRGAR